MRHAERNAKPAFKILVLVLVVLLALAVVASSAAEARQARLFAGTFGAAVSATPNPYPLEVGANSLAVDSTAGSSQGDVYVTDTANHRVEKFDSSGHFLLMFGKEVNKTAIAESATRGAEEDVCPAPGHEHDECQPGAAASTPGALKGPSVIAVDNSSGSSQGDVYVDTGSEVIAHNEIQRVALSEDVTGGTFTLSFKGAATGPIPYLATPRQVAEALEALPTIGASNVAVEYAAGASFFPSQWRIDFVNTLGDEDVSQLTATPGGLTPSGVTASISTEVNGNPLTPDLIAKFSSEGHLISTWANGGQLDGSTAPDGPFVTLVGIDVDTAGNLWVLGQTSPQAFEFKQDASFLTSWVGQNDNDSGIPDAGLALDSEDSLYYFSRENGLLKFDTAGARLGSVLNLNLFSAPTFDRVSGYAVDPTSNNLFVTVERNEENSPSYTEVQRYIGPACHPSGDKNPCAPVESFGRGRLEGLSDSHNGLAVDPSSPTDTVYSLDYNSGQVTAFSTESVPDVATTRASGFTPTSATLNGNVNPSGSALTGCFFEWGETSSYGHTVECEPNAAAVGSGSSSLPVHADIAVEPGKTYHFRLVASDAATDLAEEPSRSSDLAFGPPLVESGSALSVSATSATLQLQVNPNDVDTHARIEYGTETGVYPDAGQTVDLGNAGSVQSVSFNLQGLDPSTTYHYRVDAQSVLGDTEGSVLSFTTQGSFASVLPDSRGWELVSPPDKHGVALETMSHEGGVIQAAADGTAITYVAQGSIGDEASGNRSTNNSQLLSTRADSSWNTSDVSTPHQAPSGLSAGNPTEYKLFSTDLSVGAVEPFGATPLSPSATEKTPYLLESDHSYVPLVTAANVPPGVEFGGESRLVTSGEFIGWIKIVTATPDLSHVLLESPKALTAEFAPDFDPSYSKGKPNFYEWSAGALQLVNQVPLGSAPACGGSASACIPASELGQNSSVGAGRQFRHAVSADGSRVVFGSFVHSSGGSETPSHLYLRDISRDETIALEIPQAGATGESGGATYQDASLDGSRVFFTDGSRLTVNSAAEQKNPDLYMCQVEEKEGHIACRLTDLTANTRDPSEPADVLGSIVGASEDGSSVYFVAKGALTTGGGAVHGDNLYRYDVETNTTRLVAVLSSGDAPDWADGGDELGDLTARVSPNGRYLAFMSQRSITGYDNRDAATGQPDEEVYLYDAAADGGEGRLICASCNPTGARPHGLFDAGFFAEGGSRRLLVDGPGLWGGNTLAASIPGWTGINVNHEALYQSRYLSDSGRLFFNAADALVPQDTNGTEDVYEFEFPQGPGQPPSDSCSSESPTYSPVSGGCVNPMSSGTSPEESAFLDASESGDDVFFLTASRLASKDVDGAADVYDASVGGGEAEPVKPPPCEGDACQNPVQAPDDPTPGSLTFSGPGNPTSAGQSKPSTSTKKVVRCKKPKKLRHGVCLKAKSGKKGKSNKGKRASDNRRAGR